MRARCFLLPLLVSPALLAGCGPRVVPGPAPARPAQAQPANKRHAVRVGAQLLASSASMQSLSAPAPQSRDIAVEIVSGTYAPNSILVNQGDRVTLRLTAKDGTYGFHVEDLGIPDVTVPRGQTVSVTIPTDKIGFFTFWDQLHPEQGDRLHWHSRGIIHVWNPS